MNTSHRAMWPAALAVLGLLHGCAAAPPTREAVEVVSGPDVGLRQPVGVALHPRGGVVVADSGNHRLVWLDRAGRVRAAWGRPGEGPGEFLRPLGVAADGRGRLYVADYLNDRVQVLAADGRPLAQWTAFGEGDRFRGPADVALDREGNVYVVEFNGGRVVKLDRAGRLLQTWGRQGHDPDEFYYPTRINTNAGGEVWVADAYNHRVKVYDAQARLRHVIGGKGGEPGRFDVPGGIAFDDRGGVWIADFFNHRLQHIAPAAEGAPTITTWTGAGMAVGPLRLPTDVAFDPRDGVLYVVDYGNNRLLRLSPSSALDQSLPQGNNPWPDTGPVQPSLGRSWY